MNDQQRAVRAAYWLSDLAPVGSSLSMGVCAHRSQRRIAMAIKKRQSARERSAAASTDVADGQPASSASTEPRSDESPAPSPSVEFPIVGIGASAGGLAAVEEFLAAMPQEGSNGVALVLVQHLDPDHKSILLDLVRRFTRMKVEWASDGTEVLAGHAYIMPPNSEMALAGGRLVLRQPEEPRGLRLPIDYFFRSLAADQHERAVCVVLSGTGSDGSLGLRAIKGEGGMAIVQTPETAAYDGMPRSAIATGLVDYVLPPAHMPDQLLGYVSRVLGHGPEAKAASVPESSRDLMRVMHLLRDRSGHDFTHYKSSTLRRRVERRMAVTRTDDIEHYLALLERDTLEAETLFRELLIGVTSFFRDPAAFEALADKAIPALLAGHSQGDPVRVWVPGCSTGEEAFTIAILLLEGAAKLNRHVPVQVFATDIDIQAIERARAGTFPGSIAIDVTPERLERFFVQDQDTYRVTKAVRDCLVFAKQDMTKDPPFSKVDLISCRNVLIYMDGELQKRLIPLFHYALNSDGFLLLGSSETVGDAAQLFTPVDKKWKLFRRGDTATPRHLPLARTPVQGLAGCVAESPKPPDRHEPTRVRELAEKRLLADYAPPCAVVSAEGDVLYIHGRTGRFLEPAMGEPTGSIVKMAREGLRHELATGIRKALASGEAVRYERLLVRADDVDFHVNLTVEPIAAADGAKGSLLVVFETVSEPENAVASGDAPPPDTEQRIADLDRELTAKEEHLRATVEVLETSNEELMSTNEELQSANEELQSTNEELETSREELQSVNEELVTVNNELQQKIEEVSRANNDMSNMFAGTGIGTLFLDRDARIVRYTPAVSQIMSLIPTDIGRPLRDMASRLSGDTDVVAVVDNVLETLATVDAQVRCGDRYFQMRAQPYRTLENVIEGAVLTFVDVTEQQLLQDERDALAQSAADAGELAQGVLDTVAEPQLILDGGLTVTNANTAFLTTFGLEPTAILGRPLAELGGGAWNQPELIGQLLAVLPENRRVDGIDMRVPVGTVGPRDVTLSALELVRSPGKPRLILLAVHEVEAVPDGGV